MLWLTSFSFVSGVFFFRKKSKISILQFCTIILFLFLIFKFIKIKNINLFIISVYSIALCVFIRRFKI